MSGSRSFSPHPGPSCCIRACTPHPPPRAPPALGSVLLTVLPVASSSYLLMKEQAPAGRSRVSSNVRLPLSMAYPHLPITLSSMNPQLAHWGRGRFR